jgi:hypothetical protein
VEIEIPELLNESLSAYADATGKSRDLVIAVALMRFMQILEASTPKLRNEYMELIYGQSRLPSSLE